MVGGRHAIVRTRTPRQRKHTWLWLPSIIAVIAITWLVTESMTSGVIRAAISPAPHTISPALTTSDDDNDFSSQTEPNAAPAVAKATPPAGTQTSEGANKEEPKLRWLKHTIRRGDTLSRIFNRHSLPASEAIRIAAHPQAMALRRLQPGQVLELGVDKTGTIQEVRYRLDPLQALYIDLSTDALKPKTVDVKVNTTVRIAHGSIQRNLFVDGAKSGLDDKLIMQMVAIFGWDVDFALDLRKGDSFAVAYEELFDGDRKIGTNHILAAQFVNRGRALLAFRHVDSKGEVEYYDENGNNLRGTFLRTPMKISRITSGFSKRRFHPLLKKWRAHRGVDYAAPTGTPILATADGRVKFLGRNGGYGKCVILRHGGKFSTLYAHLSRFRPGLRNGARVRQGQVLGYVGRTGLATGPHLHYEFRVNGEHRNPLTQVTPKAHPIAQKYKADFLASVQIWSERLAKHDEVQVAAK